MAGLIPFLYGLHQQNKAREQFRGLLGSAPSIQTQPMEGPLLAGQSRPDITAMSEGTGLLGGKMTMPEFYAQAAAIPGYEQMGMQGLLANQQAQAKLEELKAGGPFQGTGMDAQTYNTIIGYNQKLGAGQKPTSQEDMAYKLAYARASQPQRYATPDGTMYEVPPIDLGGFVPPGGGLMQPTDQPGKVIGQKDLPVFRKNVGNLASFASSAQDLLSEIGKSGGEMVPGTQRYGQLQGMHTDLIMQAKNLYELGALQAPDIALIERLLPDPTSIATGVKGAIFGPEEMIGKMKALEPVIERGKKALEQKYGMSIAKEYGKFPSYGVPQQKPSQGGIKFLGFE